MRQISTTLAPQIQSASGHRVADKGTTPTESRIHVSNALNLSGQAHALLPLKTAQSVGPQKADYTNAALRKKRLDEDDVLAEEGRSQVMTAMVDVDAMADTLPAQDARLYAQASTAREVATDAGTVSNSAGSITTATTSAPALGSVGLLGLGGFTFVGLAAAGLSGSKPTPTPTADSTAPKLDLSMAGTPQQGVTVVFTFSFNEDVTGFTSSSIKLSGGTPGNFVAVDARTFTLEVTVGSSGQPLTVSVAPGAAKDLAGNAYAEGLVFETTSIAPPVEPPSPLEPPAPTPDTTAPKFTLGTAASVAFAENATGNVHMASATDNVAVMAYAFAGGKDDDKFNLDTSSGAITFKTPPDFEAPGSAAGSNSYSVKVKASDAAGNSTVQTVTVNVTDVEEVLQGQLIDSPVAGVEVWANGAKIGTTDAGGYFDYTQAKSISFKIGNLTLADGVKVPGDQKVYIHDLVGVPRTADATSDPRIAIMAQLLQSLDQDNNPGNGISVDTSRLKDGLLATRVTRDTQVSGLLDAGIPVVDKATALDHLHGNSPFLVGSDNQAPTASITLDRSILGLNQPAKVTVQFSEVVRWDNDQTPLETIMSATNATLRGFWSSDGGKTYVGTLVPKVGVSAVSSGSEKITLDLSRLTDVSGKKGGTVASAVYTVDTPIINSDLVFSNMGSHKIGDSSVQDSSINYTQELGDVGGYYRTLFEMAAASYVHPSSLFHIPTMGQKSIEDLSNASNRLKINSLDDLQKNGVVFDLTAEDLGLHLGVNNNSLLGYYSVAYSDGFFVAYNENSIDTSSVALVGRAKDALFISFRGTDGPGDMIEDALFGPVGMTQHYKRFESLISGIEAYANNPENGIKKIYVSGHSLGGEMTSIFMLNHPDTDKLTYQSVTFAPANKALGENMRDPRAISFELHEDWVPDLSYTNNLAINLSADQENYGKVVHLNYAYKYGRDSSTFGVLAEAHYLTSFNDEIDRVFSALPDPHRVPIISRYYLDQVKNPGIIITDNESPNWNAASVLENNKEIAETDYRFNLIFQNIAQNNTLIVKAVPKLSNEHVFVLNENSPSTIVLANDRFTSSENFKLDARYTTGGVYLMGNDANNVLVGGAGSDVLVGNGDKDILIGGADNDILFGGNYLDKLYPFTTLTEGRLNPNHVNTIKEHLGTEVSDDVSFMRGGAGRDDIICSRDDLGVLGDNDYCFIDVDLTEKFNDVDTIWNFNPDAGLAFSSDYLIFSALQFGMTEDQLDAIASQSGKLLGQKVWNLNARNFETDNDYNAPDAEPMFFLDNNWLYYDADGSSGDNTSFGEVLVKFMHIQGEMNDIDGANILFVLDFEELDWGKPDLPNQVPVFTLGEYASIDLTEDAGTGRTLSTLATDLEGDAITAYGVKTNGRLVNVTVDPQTGDWRWATTAAAQSLREGETAQETITLQATDANDSIGTGTITFTVTGLNDAPVLAMPQAITYTDTTATDSFTAVAGQLGGLDVDTNTTLTYGVEGATTVTGGYTQDGITYGLSRTGSYGTLYLNSSSGAYVYLPDNAAINAASAAATDTFTLTTSDGSLSASQTLQVNIAGVPEGGTGTYTPGQASIDLGEYGNLIAPVFVDGKWYYVWDMNGDGAHSDVANSNGKFHSDGSVANAAGTGWQYDYMTHNVLDNIFKFASDFITQDSESNIDNTHRFAQINGVKLALPTIGDGSVSISRYDPGNRAGTVVDNTPAGEANPTYNDLLAIWDAHNGSGTDWPVSGTPVGWQDAPYFSATQSDFGHAAYYFGNGGIYANPSGFGGTNYYGPFYAAIQVLPATPDTIAPTLTITDNVSGTATGDVLFTFTFSEAVTNFSANDVVLSAGTKGTFTTVNASTYTLSVTPPRGSGSFTVDVDHLNGIVTDAAGNALGAVAAVTQAYDIPTYTPGQATISLGEYGNLIAPVYVDGKWNYAWDMNGDGVHNSSQDTTGKFATSGSVANTAGTGYQYDYMTHDLLDGIFRFASDFTTQDTDNDTDNMYRFAQINGVKLALPSIGDGSTIVSGTNSRAGTVVDNAPAGEENLTYNDLLAIWDAHNGNATGQFLNGTPAGWQPSSYWSATPAVHGYHAFLDSGSGIVYDYASIYETIYSFAAVQVM